MRQKFSSKPFRSVGVYLGAESSNSVRAGVRADAGGAGTEGRCLPYLWSLGNLWLQCWQRRPPVVTATVPRYLTPLSMMQVRT